MKFENASTEKKLETQEDGEVFSSVGSPEAFKLQIVKRSKEETDIFLSENKRGLEEAESRASTEGLVVDGQDKEELLLLDQEAMNVKTEFLSQITPPSLLTEVEKWTPESNFPPPIPTESEMVPPPLLFKNISAMKERVIENPELLSTKETSRKLLAEERIKLAQEIREQRKMQHVRLSRLRAIAENAQENISDESGEGHYGKISEFQSREANLLAERVSSGNLVEQDVQEEKENLHELIGSSDSVRSLKKKLEDHYAKAGEIAQLKFESVRKTVEQTLIRNNAFIVHTFLLDERLRHNDNSNISSRATLEDDMDILLSLEPSISTSSVVPGSRQGLWGGRIGVVLGGGDIRGVVQTDNGTVTGGIKIRNGEISSSQEIDEKVSDKSERGYNELVVNNPKVFGFFQNVSVDESGKMIGFSAGRSDGENMERKDDFMKYIDLAKEKGMPPLIMTPDRRLFEFLSIDNSGIVSVGSEITPEQVALGNAGLSNEKRKVIGEAVVSKNLFKYMDHQKEAKGIVTELSGQENAEMELSRDEYLAYAKDNSGRFHELPKFLLDDKEFMLEAAQFDPVSAYEYAGENLKKDIGFIRHIYSLEKKNIKSSIYSYMPEDIKKNESVALLAIENDDFENIESDLANSQVIWEKIVDKIVEKKNPDRWFSRNVGEMQIPGTYFSMRKGYDIVDMTERLLADANFIQKLNDSYPKYKFEIDDYDQLLVTKLA